MPAQTPLSPRPARARRSTGAARRARRGAAAALAVALASALAAAGCGSSGGEGTEADPASVVPASAPVYLGATVRPSGSERTGALAAGRQLTGQADPYLRLLGALRTPGSPPLTFSPQVSGWLGPHAGMFVSSLRQAESLLTLVEAALTGKAAATAPPFSRSRLDGAIVMDTSNASAARSFLATQAHRAGAGPASYRGVSYEVTSGGLAFGLVGRFAVIGSEAGLRAVIGTHAGEPSLTSAAGYSKLASAAPSGAIGHLYVNPAAGGAGSGGGSALLALLAGDRETNASLIASSGSLALDVDSLAAAGTSPGLLSAEEEASSALSELPGESWLAVGLGHVGTSLSADVAGLRELGSLLGSGSASQPSALSLGSLVEGLTQPLQIMAAPTARAKGLFASWMRSAGIFAAGSSVLELKAAVVFSSDRPTRSRVAAGKLAAELRRAGNAVTPTSVPGAETAFAARVSGVPLQLVIAAGRGPSGTSKFVLGLGEASVQAALSPSTTMQSAPSRSAAAAALGEGIQPSLVVDFPTLLSLLEGIGLTENPSLSPLLPYLHAAGSLSGGGRSLGGEVERFRLVLGIHQGG